MHLAAVMLLVLTVFALVMSVAFHIVNQVDFVARFLAFLVSAMRIVANCADKLCLLVIVAILITVTSSGDHGSRAGYNSQRFGVDCKDKQRK